jgi:hypothetical protein
MREILEASSQRVYHRNKIGKWGRGFGHAARLSLSVKFRQISGRNDA